MIHITTLSTSLLSAILSNTQNLPTSFSVKFYFPVPDLNYIFDIVKFHCIIFKVVNSVDFCFFFMEDCRLDKVQKCKRNEVGSKR